MPPRSFSKITIVAHGEPMDSIQCRRLRRARFTIALDGAAELARKEGWLPDLIAGDLDSARPSTLRAFAKRGVPILSLPDQDNTDLEKTVRWALERGARSIWILQGFGKRIDHSFVNLALLKKFHSAGLELRLFRDGESVRFVKNERLRLRGRKGRALALLPFPRCRATSRGLAYELHKHALTLGKNSSACNSARLATVEISVRGEALLVEGLEP